MWAVAPLSLSLSLSPPCAALRMSLFHKPTNTHRSTTKYFDNKDSIFTHNLLHNRRHATFSVSCSASSDDPFLGQNQDFSNEKKGFWQKWKENSAEMSRKVAKLGLAAVLAYGIFDGVTYTSFFVLAFLGYEKSTGKNPAANLKALLGIVILMWGGNNVTRPFRVAGAAALAPLIDRGLRRIQKYFNFPTVTYAFALVVGIVVGLCATPVGLLILSRWGK